MLLHVVTTVLVAIVKKVFGKENFDKSHQLTTNQLKKKEKKKKNLENLLIIGQIIKQTNKQKQTNKTNCFVTPRYIYT